MAGQLETVSSAEPVIKYMEPYLRSFIDRFKGINSSGELQLALAKWYFDNKRFAQGYICLAESIVTRILETYRGKDPKIGWGNENRDKIKNLVRNRFAIMPEYKTIFDVYESIRKKRNTIAHAGFSKSQNFASDIQYAEYYLNTVEKAYLIILQLKRIPELFPFATLK